MIELELGNELSLTFTEIQELKILKGLALENILKEVHLFVQRSE